MMRKEKMPNVEQRGDLQVLLLCAAEQHALVDTCPWHAPASSSAGVEGAS